jgi:hypothetical protein
MLNILAFVRSLTGKEDLKGVSHKRAESILQDKGCDRLPECSAAEANAAPCLLNPGLGISRM